MKKQQQQANDQQHQHSPIAPIMRWPDSLDSTAYGMRMGDAMGSGTSAQSLGRVTHNTVSNSSQHVRKSSTSAASATANAFEDQTARTLDLFSNKRMGYFEQEQQGQQQQQSTVDSDTGTDGVSSVEQQHPCSTTIAAPFNASTSAGNGYVLEPAWSTTYGITDPSPSVDGAPPQWWMRQGNHQHFVGPRQVMGLLTPKSKSRFQKLKYDRKRQTDCIINEPPECAILPATPEDEDVQRLHEMKEYFLRPPRTQQHAGVFVHHQGQHHNPHDPHQQQHQQRNTFFDNTGFRASRQEDATAVDNGSNDNSNASRRADNAQQNGVGSGLSGGNGIGRRSGGGGGIVDRFLWTGGGATVTPGVLVDDPAASVVDGMVESQSGDDGADVGGEFDPQADCRPGGGVAGIDPHHSGQQAGVTGVPTCKGGAAGGSPTSFFWRDVGEPVNVNTTYPWDMQLPNPAPPLALPHASSLCLRGGGGPQEPTLSRLPARGSGGSSFCDHSSGEGLDMIHSGRGGPGAGSCVTHGVSGCSENSAAYGGAMRWGSGGSQSTSDTCFTWGLANGGGSADTGYPMASRHIDDGRRCGPGGIQSSCDPLDIGLPPPPPQLGSRASCGLDMMVPGTCLSGPGPNRFTTTDLHHSLGSVSVPYRVETGCTQRAAAAAFGLSGEACGSGGNGGSRVKRTRDVNWGGGAAAFPSEMTDGSPSHKQQSRLVPAIGGSLSGAGHHSHVASNGGGSSGGTASSGSTRKTPASSRKCRQEGCQSHPNFGMEGERRALYCAKHKLPGMINVKAPRCQDPQCNINPVYGHQGDPRATFCLTHKTPEMVDVKNRCCQYAGCKHQPSFGMVGDRRANFCFAHKLPSHVNIRRARKRLT